MGQLTGSFRAAAKNPFDMPAVGNRVILSKSPQPDIPALISEICPRRTILCRKHPKRLLPQVLAANLDCTVIVLPPNGPDTAKRSERYLVAALGGGSEPVVVVNKSDTLTRQGQEEAASAVRRRLGPSIPVILASAKERTGLSAIAELLRNGRIAALVGPSGVGKSSITNALAGRQIMQTASTTGAKRGRRTTVHRQLVPVGPGFLVDTPGLDDIIPWGGDPSLMHCDAARDGLPLCFPDIEGLIAQCRFSDCDHHTSNGCALQDAVSRGSLSSERLDSWAEIWEDTDIPDQFGQYIAPRTGRPVTSHMRRVPKDRDQKRTRSGYGRYR